MAAGDTGTRFHFGKADPREHLVFVVAAEAKTAREVEVGRVEAPEVERDQATAGQGHFDRGYLHGHSASDSVAGRWAVRGSVGFGAGGFDCEDVGAAGPDFEFVVGADSDLGSARGRDFALEVALVAGPWLLLQASLKAAGSGYLSCPARRPSGPCRYLQASCAA